ncbi:hypothetical protein BDA96_03G300300 [Sorghum bicolor]|uniref:GDT1 family protein n=2 Tax=Sorghum bicolor TaxID=4558 RepID=C5XIC0_SORBI|nr:hypothetical protein SORBI_3003G278000 [Sorghum bicolor]KAG0539179.1 hypothetical protein BDA96_03G300300 [Sorghum bicolor]
MRPRALALVSFLAAALLCLCAAAVVAAASPVSVAGKLAVEGMGMALEQGIDHLLVLAAVFVMCLFR